MKTIVVNTSDLVKGDKVLLPKERLGKTIYEVHSIKKIENPEYNTYEGTGLETPTYSAELIVGKHYANIGITFGNSVTKVIDSEG